MLLTNNSVHRKKDEALINIIGNILSTILGFAFRSDLVGLGAITLLSLHMGTMGGRRRRAWLACVSHCLYISLLGHTRIKRILLLEH